MAHMTRKYTWFFPVAAGAAVLLALLALTVTFDVSTFTALLAGQDRGATPVLAPSPPTIYGHVHVAKTAGTTLNGRLAARFDNVCGHKGYSLDFYQALKVTEKHIRPDGTWKMKERTGDLVDKSFPKFSRTRVPQKVMDEIGYENCDYISLETSWSVWNKRFKNWPFPIELHVPCRDPLSHLMSRCNYVKHTFVCSTDEARLEDEIRQCMRAERPIRFHSNLIDQFPGIKCFDYNAIDEYVEFMAPKLRERRWQVEYVHRTTNEYRNKSAECIWDEAHAESRAMVERLLHTKGDAHHLVKFCDACMGSENELPLKDFAGRREIV
jgi:hypothetical protein